jgi:hypothetical protein
LGKLIPARYIAEHEVTLNKLGGPYVNGDGQPLLNLVLKCGQTLMMLEDEVIGMTWLTDPRREKNPIYLGAGRVVLPEHSDKSPEELSVLGYQFHEGRPDFEPINPTPAPVRANKKKEGVE